MWGKKRRWEEKQNNLFLHTTFIVLTRDFGYASQQIPLGYRHLFSAVRVGEEHSSCNFASEMDVICCSVRVFLSSSKILAKPKGTVKRQRPAVYCCLRDCTMPWCYMRMMDYIIIIPAIIKVTRNSLHFMWLRTTTETAILSDLCITLQYVMNTNIGYSPS